VIEFHLGTSTVSGGAPYLIHHVERVPGLVKTTLDVQVSSSISTDYAAEIGKFLCREVLHYQSGLIVCW